MAIAGTDDRVSLAGRALRLLASLKLTLVILVALAIGIILTYTNPSQMAVLWVDELGRTLIAAAVACLVAAHFVIRRLVDIRI